MSTSGGTSGGAVSVATATLATAAINTLFSAPTPIIAAPGANRVIEILDVTAETVPGAAGNWSLAGTFALYCAATPPVTRVSEDIGGALDMLAGSALPNSPQFRSVTGLLGTSFTTALRANAALVVASNSADPQRIGGLTAVAIGAPGSGYAVNDTGTVDQDFYGGNAAYRVTAVDGGGGVTGITITAAGTGYGEGDTALLTTVGGAQPGAGNGLEITATTVIQPLGTLYVTCSYRIVTTH